MQDCVDLERKLLKSLGIAESEYSISQEYLPNGNSIHNIQFKSDCPDKPQLLMIHGYFSCNISLFKFYKILSSEFNITSIDLPGFGLSGDVGMNALNSNQEWIDYFNQSISFSVSWFSN